MIDEAIAITMAEVINTQSAIIDEHVKQLHAADARIARWVAISSAASILCLALLVLR